MTFDPRILRVGVEVQGQVRWYEGLDMLVNATKQSGAQVNNATIKITNLQRRVRDFILTETTPWNQHKVRKKIIVEAGRVSYGVSRIFVGDIIGAVPTQPPDIGLTITARTNEFARGQMVSSAQAATVPMRTIAQDIAQSMGLTLRFEAQDKQIANYSFTGGAAKQVGRLGEFGRVNAYVDDDTLVVKDVGAALQNVVTVLSAESGMVGIPETTEQGIKVKYLFEPTSRCGGQLTVASKINPSVNGAYNIYAMTYELASRDAPWYTIAECYKQGRFKK